MAFDGGLIRIPLVKPSAGPISCTVPLTTKTVTTDRFNGVTTYSKSGLNLVTLICFGGGFGPPVNVKFSKIVDSHAFSGTHSFCWVQKCSNGAPTTGLTTVSGRVTSQTGISTIELKYEFRALCGGETICIEEGSFTGTNVAGHYDPLNAVYNGPQTWTYTCCPDVVWRDSIFPV